MEDEKKHVGSKTLFIRNLPFTITNEKLEAAFGDIGPLKRCFVVKEKGTDKSRGFGYVRFSILEDALTAKEKVISLDGRPLFISFAAKKEIKKLQKTKREEIDDKSDEDHKTAEPVHKDSSNVVKPTTAFQRNVNFHYQQAKTVVLTGFTAETTVNEVQKCLEKLCVKNVADVEFPVKDRALPTAFIKFKCVRDTKRAIRRLLNKEYKDMTLAAVQLTKDEIQKSKDVSSIPQKVLKRARLIVRNLSFKSTEKDLRNAFGKYGFISEVKIPTKPDGRMHGFGFVQFTNKMEANQALTEMNSQPLLGRPIAVDWAVPKDKFKAAVKPTTEPGTEEVATNTDSEESAESDHNSDSGSATVGTEESDDEGESREEEEQDESSEEEEQDSAVSSNSDEESDDSVEETINKAKRRKESQKKSPAKKSDVEEGRTLFILNLPFEATDEDVTELFSEYGDIQYCKLVMDPQTDHPKGTAFLQFKKKADADECFEIALKQTKDGGITMSGRRLVVRLALPRGKAQELSAKDKKKENIDKRNLFLAREGMIRPGTQTAVGLSKGDIDKRMKVEAVKRQKLQNLNIFISPTRLCVRNLPTNVDDAELRKVFCTATGDSKAKVTECRVMRDLARVNSQGVGKSRGYGFVAFSEHQHALLALRQTNNNAEIFGDTKRLIVEFSLENKKALVAKEKRIERVQSKQEAVIKAKGDQSLASTHRKKAKSSVQSNVLPAGEKGTRGPKGLPSHWGPKVRHKPRQPQTKPQKSKLKQAATKRKEHQNFPTEAPSPKKRKKNKDQTDDFDRLVNHYKQRFLSAGDKKSKWYNE